MQVQVDGSRCPANVFFSFTQSCFFVFSFLVFRGNLIDLCEIQVTWEMRDVQSSRHEWFDTKSKVNLLRWLVCSAVVLNLNVQVAHLYKNITD